MSPSKPFKGFLVKWKILDVPEGTIVQGLCINGVPDENANRRGFIRTSLIKEIVVIRKVETLNSQYFLLGDPDDT